jgi:Outer membrane lipoprotein-sorting protein
VRALAVRKIWIVLGMLLTGGITLIAQQTPDLNDIVARMEAARLRSKQTEPFQITREYKMFHGDDAQPASEVKAEINVVPPKSSAYKIVEAKGSGRGERVVRKILDHEAEAEKSSPPPTALVPANYDFGFEGEQDLAGVRCLVLSLRPKREDASLVKGRAWVDANTFLIRKVEGEMAKSPSWLVKDVRLTVRFGEIRGVWTQTSTEAVADVRWFGKYSVNGRATDLQMASATAANRDANKLARKHRRSLPAEAVYGTGVLVTR